jgi:pimeloyl-ACP methyl ester carboxylesterase
MPRFFRFSAFIAALAACAHPPAVPPDGHYAEINGLRMYYVLTGSGSPLLLLHGGAGNGEQFAKQIPAFAPRHRLIIPDCAEQGRTSGREGPLTYHAMAEDMISLLDHLGIKQVDVMGWSDGGNIGLDMAMHHPERVSHLVTFGANFRPDGLNQEDVAWNQTATAASFGAGMEEGWKKLAQNPARYVLAMNKILDLWRTQPNWTTADLRTIHVRTMICVGDHDLIRPEHTRELAAAIPGAVLWTVPDASHSAMIERPELVNPRVLAFLDK